MHTVTQPVWKRDVFREWFQIPKEMAKKHTVVNFCANGLRRKEWPCARTLHSDKHRTGWQIRTKVGVTFVQKVCEELWVFGITFMLRCDTIRKR